MDAAEIASVWPAEFAWIEPNPLRLRRKLRRRFAKGMPCFIAVRDGHVASAIWCRPWRFEAALPPEHRRAEAFELVNGFVSAELRGHGVSAGLLAYAMERMGEDGFPVAFSRLDPGNSASIRVKAKVGFAFLGMFVCGVSVGRKYHRLNQHSLSGIAPTEETIAGTANG